MRQGITRHQKQHDLHYLEFDPENDALITGGSVALVRLAQDGGKKRIFDDSVTTAATACGFASDFFLCRLWDVLVW